MSLPAGNLRSALTERRFVPLRELFDEISTIKDFTGISAPYEPPTKPELELRTDLLSIEDCVTRVMAKINAVA